MSRELKFRAKIKGDAGVYLVRAIDWLWERALVSRACGDEWVSFKKIEQLMQYIGLKDKTEIEVYEGDIVAIRREDDGDWGTGNCERAVIEYYDGYAAFVLTMYSVYGGEGYESLVGGEVGKYYRDRIEIIGNIYEHKELLK